MNKWYTKQIWKRRYKSITECKMLEKTYIKTRKEILKMPAQPSEATPPTHRPAPQMSNQGGHLVEELAASPSVVHIFPLSNCFVLSGISWSGAGFKLSIASHVLLVFVEVTFAPVPLWMFVPSKARSYVGETSRVAVMNYRRPLLNVVLCGCCGALALFYFLPKGNTYFHGNKTTSESLHRGAREKCRISTIGGYHRARHASEQARALWRRHDINISRAMCQKLRYSAKGKDKILWTTKDLKDELRTSATHEEIWDVIRESKKHGRHNRFACEGDCPDSRMRCGDNRKKLGKKWTKKAKVSWRKVEWQVRLEFQRKMGVRWYARWSRMEVQRLVWSKTTVVKRQLGHSFRFSITVVVSTSSTDMWISCTRTGKIMKDHVASIHVMNACSARQELRDETQIASARSNKRRVTAGGFWGKNGMTAIRQPESTVRWASQRRWRVDNGSEKESLLRRDAHQRRWGT